ncbi:unnamed protein product [Vitrella brassicaformis CCMP3155]|uniref:Uncharacterized protein n=1 Tax=Vitrella brassicaformis (strain CCMP3155) TaxID=1169540 RepID=A0A0G4EW79_VITBC|nr:unnamed protein product [Vitrella brassicaformis CCMP3155]|eukprot:CEM02713.1 unnamed protein product [Vitrella brassicaformis CCMP3155]
MSGASLAPAWRQLSARTPFSAFKTSPQVWWDFGSFCDGRLLFVDKALSLSREGGVTNKERFGKRRASLWRESRRGFEFSPSRDGVFQKRKQRTFSTPALLISHCSPHISFVSVHFSAGEILGSLQLCKGYSCGDGWRCVHGEVQPA